MYQCLPIQRGQDGIMDTSKGQAYKEEAQIITLLDE